MEFYKKPRDGPLDLSTAMQIIVVEAAQHYLALGGPEKALAELQSLAKTLSYRDDWNPAQLEAESFINQHLMEQEQQKRQQQQQDMNQMMLSLMAVVRKLASPPPPPAAPPPKQPPQKPDLSVSHICWSLRELQATTGDNGKPLFTQANHWQAVFRILVDYGMFSDNDYDGFDQWMLSNIPTELRTKYSKQSVKNISQTLYNKPLDRWTYDPALEKTRQPFERMQAIAKRFQELLFLPDGLPAT